MQDTKPSKEFIEGLPVLTVKIGNEPKKVRYDPINKMVYQLDDDENWSGKMGQYNLDALLSPGDDAAPTQEADAVPLTNEVETETDAPQQESANPQDLAPCDTEEYAPSANEDTIVADNPACPVGELDPTIPISENPTPDANENSDIKAPINLGKAVIFGSILGGIIILVIIVCVLLFSGKNKKIPIPSEPVQQTEQTDVSGATETYTVPETQPVTDPSEEVPAESEVQETAPAADVYVLCPSQALIPGQILTEDIITSVGISNSEYRQLTSSIGLYTEDNLSSIVGLVATKYIAAETFLTYDNLSNSYAPLNPWTAEQNTITTITLPVTPHWDNLVYFTWGNTVDLTITVETKQTNSNDTTETEDPPEGLEHESSVVESMVLDTYKLQGVRIIDVVNAQNQSLFPYYMSIASIPSGFQRNYLDGHYPDVTAFEPALPCFLTIEISKAQAEVLTKLDPSCMTITVTNPVAINSNILQNDTYNSIRNTLALISDLWQTRMEESSNAGSES